PHRDRVGSRPRTDGPREPDARRQTLPLQARSLAGGRLYRDLGNSTGHLWGHVQVIKPPKILEIWGPMMMSYPAVNHLQYRLTADGASTRLQLTHRAMGIIEEQHRDGLPKGFEHWVRRIKHLAENRSGQR